MGKRFLQVLCLAGAFAFAIPVSGYCDSINQKKKSVALEYRVNDDDLYNAVREGNFEKTKDLINR